MVLQMFQCSVCCGSEDADIRNHTRTSAFAHCLPAVRTGAKIDVRRKQDRFPLVVINENGGQVVMVTVRDKDNLLDFLL